MARRVNDLDLQATTIEGGILNASTIQKVQKLEADRQKASDYDVEKGLDLRDEINRGFRILGARVADFEKSSRSILQVRTLAEHLFGTVLGFDLTFHANPTTVDGREFRPAFTAGHVPIVLATPSDEEGKAGVDMPSVALADGRRKRSAAGMLQEFLNADETRMWGFAFDGRMLRLMRDNASLTRPAFIEFDVSRIVGETLYAEFSTLWLICHASRFCGAPEDTIIEGWKQAAKDDGVVARDRLRDNFRAMLSDLGNGLLEHPRNEGLRTALAERRLDAMTFQGDLLRFAYRVIFLITIEDRDVLHHPESTPEARTLYRSGYALSRLRDKALARPGEAGHHDLWLGLRLVFSKLATGDAAIGLPALGGLFDGRLCFDDAFVSNKRFLSALRKLFWMQTPTGVVKVNWKDMETDEFGYVYEGLLELVPLIATDRKSMTYPGDDTGAGGGGKGKKAGGNKRKTTGSYYTPDSLVRALLDTALDPVVDHAVRSSDDPVSAILSLKVIDPAAGSGHFLLGAARRLAARIVEIRHGGAETAASFGHAMREVVRSCIYGVDANPLAIDLFKAALWLESVEPGKPLTFLDNKIRCGNSLFGVHDLTVLKNGISSDAYTALSGDDKKAAAHYRKLNDEFAERRKRYPGQMEIDYSSGYDAVAELARIVEGKGEDSIEEVRAKVHDYDQLLENETLVRLQMACDIWTSPFFTRKTDIRTGAAREVGVSMDVYEVMSANEPLVPTPVKENAEAIADTFNFFHWPIEFPVVMRDGGFDVVIGNPPWEKLKLVEKEFFATRAPWIADAKKKSDRQAAIDRLNADDAGPGEKALHAEFMKAKAGAEAGSEFARNSGRFPLTGVGDVNLYPLFAEHFRAITKAGRRAGLICPTGIATDKTTSRFFGDLVDAKSIVSLFDFENRKGLFKGVHRSFKFCLMTMGSNAGPVSLASYLLSTADLGDEERRYSLTAEQIARINPNTKTIPLFRAKADAELTAKIHDNVPIVFREGAEDGNPWGLRFAAMFHMSGDSGLFQNAAQMEKAGFTQSGRDWVSPEEDGRYVPLYEAKMIHQFDHRWATYQGATEVEVIEGEDGSEQVDVKPRDVTSEEKIVSSFEPQPRYWVQEQDLKDRLQRAGWARNWLIGWRDICRATDERTLISSFFPLSGSGDTLLLLFPDVNDIRLATCLLANMNSIVADYVTRQKIPGTHLKYNIFKQITLLQPGSYSDQEIAWVTRHVVRLCCSSDAMSAFARDMGSNAPPEPLEDDARRSLRAELDAFFAWKYGLSKEDLRYILDPKSVKGETYPSETFRGLREKEKNIFNEYRTQRLVLEAWDRFASRGFRLEDELFAPKAPPAAGAPLSARALGDGAWARSNPVDGDSFAVLAAILKRIDRPLSITHVRMAATFAIEAHFLTELLPVDLREEWMRLVGQEATPRTGNVTTFLRRVTNPWGDAVRSFRGNRWMVEDLAARTWAPGSNVPDFETDGWPDGRVRFVLDAMQRLDLVNVISRLPDEVRSWVLDAVAA